MRSEEWTPTDGGWVVALGPVARSLRPWWSWHRWVSAGSERPDPFSVARALVRVARRAATRGVGGEVLPCSRYEVRAHPDLCRQLRALGPRGVPAIEARLHTEVGVESPTVNLVPDRSGELALDVLFVVPWFGHPDPSSRPRLGEATLRGPAVGRAPTERVLDDDELAEAPTERVVRAKPSLLVTSKGTLVGVLESGRRYTMGRRNGDAGSEHITLPTDEPTVNRRQIALVATEDSVSVSRFGAANPVIVNGESVHRGGTIEVTGWPVEIALSRGVFGFTVTREGTP